MTPVPTLSALPAEPVPAPAPAPRPQRVPTRTLLRSAAVLAVVVGLVALALLVTDRSTGGRLDPRSATPQGSLALANLLRGQGVDVERGTAAGPARTVLVPLADLVDPDRLARLADSGADLVLLGPATVPDLPVEPGRSTAVTARDPGCTLPEAQAAGPATLGGSFDIFAGRADDPDGQQVTTCYDRSLVVVDRAGARQGRVVLLGSDTLLTNEHLARQGNAALALGLLSRQPSLTWYVDPPPGQGDGEGEGLLDLLPAALLVALLQLVIGVAAVALWRGRRLGPVVHERLPVVVPAAEAVHGRARLYAAGAARGQAAAALREGTRARLVDLLGLGRQPSPAALVEAVARRAGRPASVVGTLLYGAGDALPPAPSGSRGSAAGPPAGPADDPTLVRLADDLDRLEQEVRER